MADGFSRMKTAAKAVVANVKVAPTAKSNEMDIEPIVDPNIGKFISVHLLPTDILLDTVIEKGDVYVSRLVEIPITTFDQDKALEKATEVAGTGLGNEKVCLPQLKFNREMRITS